MGRIRVYIACSLDGFIAGPNDDLSWLPQSEVEPGDALGFTDFMKEVGALLMGRRTYDVLCGFGGPWPYGDTPVLVATHRALEPAAASVQAVSGSVQEVIGFARQVADARDVYLDGGDLIRQGLDAGLVDELIVTMVPIALGEGRPLFGGIAQRLRFEITGHHSYGTMVQVHMRPMG